MPAADHCAPPRCGFPSPCSGTKALRKGCPFHCRAHCRLASQLGGDVGGGQPWATSRRTLPRPAVSSARALTSASTACRPLGSRSTTRWMTTGPPGARRHDVLPGHVVDGRQPGGTDGQRVVAGPPPGRPACPARASGRRATERRAVPAAPAPPRRPVGGLMDASRSGSSSRNHPEGAADQLLVSAIATVTPETGRSGPSL